MRINSACQVRNVCVFQDAVDARVADLMAAEDWCGWRRQLSQFLVASGLRCLLEHVSEDEWRADYLANLGPYEAALARSERTEH